MILWCIARTHDPRLIGKPMFANAAIQNKLIGGGLEPRFRSRQFIQKYHDWRFDLRKELRAHPLCLAAFVIDSGEAA
jgi:hypothetical protein